MTQPRKVLQPYNALFVLERLGKDSWDRLNWLITFSQRTLDNMSPGDCLSLREELAVLHGQAHVGGLPFGGGSLALPSWEDVHTLQSTVREILTKWVDQGTVDLGPFTLTLELHRSASPEDTLRAARGFPNRAKAIPGQGTLKHVAHYHLGSEESPLLFYLSELLRDHASGIIRCPKCLKIFLKLRRHARYCSRECHTVAGMREKRVAARESKTAEKLVSGKSKPHGTKRRKTNGTKRRC
jgi:uncharacterized C2H2 Zn-finger protein